MERRPTNECGYPFRSRGGPYTSARSAANDLDLALRCVSKIGEDIYFLSHKDEEREISRRMHGIQALERMLQKVREAA